MTLAFFDFVVKGMLFRLEVLTLGFESDEELLRFVRRFIQAKGWGRACRFAIKW